MNKVIGLDPDHNTDTDYVTEFSVHGGTSPDKPVWCWYEWVFPPGGGEPFLEPRKPYGQTVSQLCDGKLEE